MWSRRSSRPDGRREERSQIQIEAAMSPPMMRTANTVRVRSRRRSCSIQAFAPIREW
jgi:hypothetical protein